MKIPILWRIERFMLRKREEKREFDKKVIRARVSKKQRVFGECPNCSWHKFAERNGYNKCLRCGEKSYY